MINIGQFNKLKVINTVAYGLYLDGGEYGEILLPNKLVPTGVKIGDVLDVFVYFDSEDNIIATTLQPYATVGSYAYLKVIDVNRVGAFLNWGLDKDLLVPISEQLRTMQQNKSYIVFIKQDDEQRIFASSKIDRYLDKLPTNYSQGEEVSVLIAEKTELGNKVIINNKHWGLIHTADIFQTLRYGSNMTAYIKCVRDDGKLDVVLRKLGQDKIIDLATNILKELHAKGGFLPLHDKSSVEDINLVFKDSKKSFKSAIGYLLKRGKIIIGSDGLHLVE